MTLAELKTLVETMQNLPCVMSQLEDVQVRSFDSNRAVCFFLPWLRIGGLTTSTADREKKVRNSPTTRVKLTVFDYQPPTNRNQAAANDTIRYCASS